MITINGTFLTEDITGVQRYATEIVKRLDSMVQVKDIEILVPYPPKREIFRLNNINIRYTLKKQPERFIKFYMLLWEQLIFVFYLIRHHSIGINMCNKAPLIKPDIVCIHDLLFMTHPQYFPNLSKEKLFFSFLRYYFCCKFSKIIITDSEYSAKQIINYYHVNKNKVIIIGCGWEHIKSLEYDDNIFNKYPMLQLNHYFFTLGSISPHKNIGWILNAAKKNKEFLFVVTGKQIFKNFTYDFSKDYNNVIFTGYLSDEEIHAIMRHMVALIFPSFCEGFGLPPLEALSMGKKIILSNVTSLPEIFKNSAIYIDPYDANVDLRQLLEKNVYNSTEILRKYTWSSAANRYRELIRDEYCQK